MGFASTRLKGKGTGMFSRREQCRSRAYFACAHRTLKEKHSCPLLPLQTDPIGQAGGINLYRYCGNAPSDASDPSGLWPQWLDSIVQSISSGWNSLINGISDWFVPDPSSSGGGTGGNGRDRIIIQGTNPSDPSPAPSNPDPFDLALERYQQNGLLGSVALGRPDSGPEIVEGLKASGSAALNMSMLPLGGPEAKGAEEVIEVTAKAIEESVVKDATEGATVQEVVAAARTAATEMPTGGPARQFLNGEIPLSNVPADAAQKAASFLSDIAAPQSAARLGPVGAAFQNARAAALLGQGPLPGTLAEFMANFGG